MIDFKEHKVNLFHLYFRHMKRRYFFLLCMCIVCACNNHETKEPPKAAAKTREPSPLLKALYQGVARYPDSVGLRLQLVEVLDSSGAYRPALQQMDSLLRKDSLNFGLWFRKATLQEHAKDTSGALLAYHYAARIYPSPDALLAMANLYAEQKNDKALALCAQIDAMKLGREYLAHTSFISGVYHARSGHSSKAIDLFNRCIANDYLYMEAYMEKGFLYFDAHKTEDARKVFETATAVKTNYADAWYWLAKCQEALNNRAEAIKSYQTALALDPGIAEATAALKKLGSN